MELDPGRAESHHLRGYILLVLNRTDEALQEQKKAMELDPFARRWELASALIRARRYEAALNEARLRSEAYPSDADLHGFLCMAYWHLGREKEAAQEFETYLRLLGDKASALAAHQAFERGGTKAVFEWQLGVARKKATKSHVSPLDLARLNACLKRKDESLHYLEQAYQEREPWVVNIQNNPAFDFLHSEPRYQALVKGMGLPQAF